MKKTILNYRVQILRKPRTFFTLLYVIISLALVVVGITYYSYRKDKIINDRFEYLSSVANLKTSQINNWLAGRFAQLEVLRADAPLVNELKTIGNSLKNQDVLKKWFPALRNYYQYDDVILSGDLNKVLFSISQKKIKLDSTDSLLCINAAGSSSIIFSDSSEKNINQDALKFYVPLGNSSTNENRTLILVIDPHKNFDMLLNSSIDKSQSLEALLLKPFGNGIVYLNKTKSLEEDTSKSRKALLKTSTIETRKGFVDGIDYKNDEVIALIQRIPSTCWTLITKINKSEFYYPVDNLVKIVTLAVISANLFFALILFYIWRKSIVVNYKRISEAEVEKSKLENRFESLVNGVKDIAIFILDLKGNIISWNEGAKLIAGYSPAEIIGKHFSIFYSEEEISNNKPKDNLRNALNNGSFQEEAWRIKKDGSIFWANVLLTALKDEDNSVYGYLKVIRDLTEKRKHEEEIENSRDFHLKLLDDFPNPVWRSGLNGKYNYFNKAWLNYTGRSLQDELGDGWMANLYPEDRKKVIDNYDLAFKQQKEFILEFRLKNSRNEYRWLVGFGMPYFDIKNNFAGFIGSCYDINERKKYEETINVLMRISEKLYSSLDINQILDSLIIDSIQLANADGGIACIKNDNEFEVKRYYNKDHWEYYEKRYKAEGNLFNQMLSERKSILLNPIDEKNSFDNELITKYGIKQLVATPLFGTGGEIIGFFQVHYNKLQRETAEDKINILNSVAKNASIAIVKSLNYEQLRKTENQLRSSESGLRNLTVQIQYARETERQKIAREVHDELGQLFTGINLNVSFLAERLEQNEKIPTDEMIDELNSVQQFVKIGIQTVRDIAVSLRSYVLDQLGLIPAIQEYCREIERMSSIKCIFKSSVESVNFSDERNAALFRIFQEALTNVLRHAEASHISITISQNGANLEVVISDDGIGMDYSNGAISKSMGILGMKERAIFLRGKLTIGSEKNKGTTISLTVPIK
jgi:PAS domain S-box-containing protein